MTTAAHYGNLPVMCEAAAFRPLKRPTIDLIYTSPYFVCLPFFSVYFLRKKKYFERNYAKKVKKITQDYDHTK